MRDQGTVLYAVAQLWVFELLNETYQRYKSEPYDVIVSGLGSFSPL